MNYEEYILSGIEWDTDGEDIELPTTVHITVRGSEDVIDVLSDKYGFCVKNVWVIRRI